jgi:hypothetical protein
MIDFAALSQSYFLKWRNLSEHMGRLEIWKES